MFLSTRSDSGSLFSLLGGKGGVVLFVECVVSDSAGLCFTKSWLFAGAVSLSGDFKKGLVDLATLVSSLVE